MTDVRTAEAHEEVSSSDPSDASSELVVEGELDAPDLQDDTLASVVDSDNERAKKRKRI